MASRPTSAASADGPLAGARVLVVDDHSFTVRLIKDVLYASGAASVHTARDGAEAIDMLASCNPDLVVTDWRMSGLDGLDFTRIVRQAKIEHDPRIPDPHTPIVLLSAHASVRAVEKARKAGVNEVVVKPFTIAVLLERLAAAVTKPRPFVVSDDYVGPDRRRRKDAHPDEGRRASDQTGAEPPHAADASVLKRLQAQLSAVERGPRKSTADAAAPGRAR